MQPHSARLADAVTRPHTPIGRLDILDAFGQLIQSVSGHTTGSVTADRNAANLRTQECDIPVALLSDAALAALQRPDGNVFLQKWRGIRFEDTQMLGANHNSAATWAVSGTSTGMMNSVKVDSQGAITLGP